MTTPERPRTSPLRPTLTPAAHDTDAVTYQPEPYDPAAKEEFGRVTQMVLPGQYGVVHPARRTGRGVWLVLFLVVAVAASFVGWRVLQHGGGTATSAVAYRSAAGHFSASFPGAPTESSSSARFGKIRATMHVAAVPAETTVVASGALSRPAPHAKTGLMSDVLSGMASSGELTFLSERAASFRTHPARQADYVAANGRLVTALVVVYTSHRFYVLMAPSGEEFDALEGSFTTSG